MKNLEDGIDVRLYINNNGLLIKKIIYITGEKNAIIKYHIVDRIVDPFESWRSFYFR